MPRKPKVPGAAAPVVATEKAKDDCDLPNAIDVDARTIKGPVLTKQGWVVPDEAHQKKVRQVEQLQNDLAAAKA